MEGYFDLKRLKLDELVGVINLYPWFGGARKELCARMSRMGEALSDSQCAEAAMYVVAREKIAALKSSARPRPEFWIPVSMVSVRQSAG